MNIRLFSFISGWNAQKMGHTQCHTNWAALGKSDHGS